MYAQPPAHTVEKGDLGCVASDRCELCKVNCVPEAAYNQRMGDESLHLDKDAVQTVLCTTGTPLLLRAPRLL